jgi:hypothetical protein
MLRRFASVVAVGAMAVTSYSVMVAAPASAGEIKKPNTVKVTKVVVGDSHGEGFQVVVECKQTEEDKITLGSSSKTLTFGPDGGTQDVKAANGVTCTIVETHDGGATTVDVSPSECVFPEELKLGATVTSEPEGKTCEVTVTNTFVPEEEQAGPAGPQGPQGPPGESAAATAVVSTARFTG